LPVVRREGIDWRGGIGGAPLEIRLAFENPGTVRTAPATARVEVAAFGAFLPWRPLTAVSVPAIPPGGRIVLTATAQGDLPDRENAADLVAQMDNAESANDIMSLMAKVLRAAFAWKDVDQLNMNPIHFVGNLNVFVSRRKTVERHQQRAIGLRPGHSNFTMFAVGDGKHDVYSLRLEAEPGWDVQLSGCPWDTPIGIESQSIAASITPPIGVEYGRIGIWVKRHSTGEEVPVEFELAVDARTLTCGTIVA
jgi:hypothetical protein